MKLTFTSAILALVTVVTAAAIGTESSCPANKHRICCYNLDERGTGYYCGMPQYEGEHDCGEASLIPLCCETSGNYPRGFVGNNCEKA